MGGIFGGKRYSQLFILAPSALWTAVTFWAALSWTGDRRPPPHAGAWFERMFKLAGTLFPFMSLGARLALTQWSVKDLPAKFWSFSKALHTLPHSVHNSQK